MIKLLHGLLIVMSLVVLSLIFWSRLNMTEKLFTGTLNLNQKTKKYFGLLVVVELGSPWCKQTHFNIEQSIGPATICIYTAHSLPLVCC